MARQKLLESKKQDKPIQFRVSATFRDGINAAMQKAGDPNVSEFVKKAVIQHAAKYGVVIDRYGGSVE